MSLIVHINPIALFACLSCWFILIGVWFYYRDNADTAHCEYSQALMMLASWAVAILWTIYAIVAPLYHAVARAIG